MALKQTDTGIYYIYDYIPSRSMKYHTTEENNISRMIWDLKEGDDDVIEFFSEKILHALEELSSKIHSKKIGLVAVPPSKTDKYSPLRECIEYMIEIESIYSYDISQTLYDYGTLLTRIENVPTSHNGPRVSYERHKESIACSRNNLSKYWTAFVILDDVTTKGTSMDVCRDILIEHGAKEKYIYRLAIAKTI